MVSKLTGSNRQREEVLTGAAAVEPEERLLHGLLVWPSSDLDTRVGAHSSSFTPPCCPEPGQRKDWLEEPGELNAAVRWRGRSGRLSGLRGLPWGRAPLACLDQGLSRKQNLGRAKRRDGLRRSFLRRGETALGGLDAVACTRWNHWAGRAWAEAACLGSGVFDRQVWRRLAPARARTGTRRSSVSVCGRSSSIESLRALYRERDAR